MEASELKEILYQHKLWVEGNGGKRANLRDANLTGTDLRSADLRGADLSDANLSGANLWNVNLAGANLTSANLTSANLHDAKLSGAKLTSANIEDAHLNNAIGLPNISWIEPGILVKLNNVYDGFYVEKEFKRNNFIQDSIGMVIQNNPEEGTFDLLVGDRIIRDIPNWLKYSAIKKIE